MPHLVAALNEIGQSLWLDSISRSMLRDDTLATYRGQHGVTGLTSNPSIFCHALKESHDYDATIHACHGLSPEDVFFDLALNDLRHAAGVFMPIHQCTSSVDGWVSLEVSPLLANDVNATIEQALRLHQRAAIVNLYIKVPGTHAGLQAIEELTYLGVPTNITLLFSKDQYQLATNAYIRGLERRLNGGLSIDVPSVASVFVSRWDVKAATLLPKEEKRPQLGLAVAADIYTSYCETLSCTRMQRLMNTGARAQRLLWASTGRKNPAVSETFYVEALAAPFTINTMPKKTLQAIINQRGKVDGSVLACATLNADKHDHHAVLAEFAAHGLKVETLAKSLQNEGITSFKNSWNELITIIDQRRKEAA